IGNVKLNGGTLGGGGTVTGGTVGVVTADASNGGAINPGLFPTTGILNSADVTLNSVSSMLVDLVNPIVGTGYDRLAVTGNITLGNATLGGTVGANVNIGDSFTIV